MLTPEGSAGSSSVPEDKPLSPDENARLIAFYNAARAEVIQRLSLSEQVLIGYLTVAGVIAGVAYRNGAFTPRVLILVPSFALPFGVALYRHDESIHRIGEYIRKIRPNLLIKDGNDNTKVSDWDDSEILRTQLKRHLTIEKLTYAALFVVPGVLCLVASYGQMGDAEPLYVLAVVCLAAVIVGFIAQFVRLFREKL